MTNISTTWHHKDHMSCVLRVHIWVKNSNVCESIFGLILPTSILTKQHNPALPKTHICGLMGLPVKVHAAASRDPKWRFESRSHMALLVKIPCGAASQGPWGEKLKFWFFYIPLTKMSFNTLHIQSKIWYLRCRNKLVNNPFKEDPWCQCAEKIAEERETIKGNLDAILSRANPLSNEPKTANFTITIISKIVQILHHNWQSALYKGADHIWVSFPRTGEMAISCPFFLKSRALVWPNRKR